MRTIDTIVQHYSATFAESQDIGVEEIARWHRARGFDTIGYHYVVRLDGTIETGRPIEKFGAHAPAVNKHSIGICYVGGLRKATGKDRGMDTRNRQQRQAIYDLYRQLLTRFPSINRIVGHMDVGRTQCPGYDVDADWRQELGAVTWRPTKTVDPTAPVVTWTLVKRGSRGESVRDLQKLLQAKGHYTGAALDGVFGPKTEAAVKAFQLQAGIGVDGKAGPVTWAELLKEK
jgi:N-acetyl-anhydromuramyl-L-alanine amidase AmpD